MLTSIHGVSLFYQIIVLAHLALKRVSFDHHDLIFITFVTFVISQKQRAAILSFKSNRELHHKVYFISLETTTHTIKYLQNKYVIQQNFKQYIYVKNVSIFLTM